MTIERPFAVRPRARFSAFGGDAGYWVVRSLRDGIMFQGCGFTLEAAYQDWRDQIWTWKRAVRKTT